MNSKKYNKVKKVKNNKTTRNRNKFTKKNKKIQKRNRNKFTKKMIGGDDPPASAPASSPAPDSAPASSPAPDSANASSPAPASANSPAQASANASSPGNPPNNAPTNPQGNALDNAQGNASANDPGNRSANDPGNPPANPQDNCAKCTGHNTDHNTSKCLLCMHPNDQQKNHPTNKCFSPQQRCPGPPSTPMCVAYRNVIRPTSLALFEEEAIDKQLKCNNEEFTLEQLKDGLEKIPGFTKEQLTIVNPNRSPGPGARFTYESNA